MADPIYRQIADDLRARIDAGELPQGGQLPTEIELMERYNASRNTVRDAVKVLTTRGLVETRPGQGTFVTEKVNPFVTTLTGDAQAGVEGPVYVAEVEASGRHPSTTRPRVEIHQADATIADALRVPEEAQVVSRHQQRFIDGTPWSLQTSFYPMSLVEDEGALRLLEARDIETGTVAYLADQCGIRQVGYRDSVAVRTPTENEAAFFKLPADGRIPVFEIYRVGFDGTGRRLRLTITIYRADRNRFLVNVGQVPTRPDAG